MTHIERFVVTGDGFDYSIRKFCYRPDSDSVETPILHITARLRPKPQSTEHTEDKCRKNWRKLKTPWIAEMECKNDTSW